LCEKTVGGKVVRHSLAYTTSKVLTAISLTLCE